MIELQDILNTLNWQNSFNFHSFSKNYFSKTGWCYFYLSCRSEILICQLTRIQNIFVSNQLISSKNIFQCIEFNFWWTWTVKSFAIFLSIATHNHIYMPNICSFAITMFVNIRIKVKGSVKRGVLAIWPFIIKTEKWNLSGSFSVKLFNVKVDERLASLSC